MHHLHKIEVEAKPGHARPSALQGLPLQLPDLNRPEEEECRVGTVLMARITVMVDAIYKADRFTKVPGFCHD